MAGGAGRSGEPAQALGADDGARRRASFDDAFRGVFGDSARDLYDRFRAELTWRAIEAERRGGRRSRASSGRTSPGPPAPPPSRRTARGSPSCSAPRTAPPGWWSGRRRRTRRPRRSGRSGGRRSPGAIPRTCRPSAPARSPGRRSTRWRATTAPIPRRRAGCRTASRILFVRYEPDTDGFLHPDLFLLDAGERRRSAGSPARPTCAIPIPRRTAAGRSPCATATASPQIVRVDLQTGREVTPLTEPAVDVVYDRPRISPDGRRVAYARHREGSWRLVVQELDGRSGRPRSRHPPAAPSPRRPGARTAARSTRWWACAASSTSTRSPSDGSGAPVPLTRTQGAALAPTPMPDGSGLFFSRLAAGRLRPPPAGALLGARSPRRRPPRSCRAISPPPSARPASGAPGAVRPRRRGAGPPLWRWAGRSCSPLFALQRLVHRRRLGAGGARRRRRWAASTGSPSAAIGDHGWPAGGALAGVLAGLAGRGGLPSLPLRTSAPPRGSRGPPRQPARPRPPGDRAERLPGLAVGRRRARPRRPGALGPRAARSAGTGRLDQRLASLTGAWGGYRRWGLWRVEPALGAHYEAGQHRARPAPGPAGGRRPARPRPRRHRPRALLAARRLAGLSASASTATSSAARETSLLPELGPVEPHLRARPAGGSPGRHRPRGRAGRAHPRLPARPRLLRAPPRLGLRRRRAATGSPSPAWSTASASAPCRSSASPPSTCGWAWRGSSTIRSGSSRDRRGGG